MNFRAERRRWVARSLALAAMIILGTACLLSTGCGEKESEAPPIVRPVKLMTIGTGADGGIREYPGQVRAAEEIQLSFEVPGRIVELNAAEGSRVDAGALIAALDPSDYEATRDRDRARRNEARADYERNRALYERDAISLRDLEFVRRRFEVTEANLKTTEKALRDTRLLAPFDGKIAGRMVEIQENVQAKEPIVLFVDDSSLEVRASFPESDYLRIRDLGSQENMTAALKPRIEVSAAPGRTIDAWVKELRGTADPVTRTYEVTLGFEAPDGVSITSGMTARVIVTMQNAVGAIQVPVVAVISDQSGGSRVFVYDEASSTVTGRDVVIGRLMGDEIEILSGLERGDRIAVLGASNLSEGMKVRPLDD